MKKATKILSLILALVLCVALFAACGDAKEEEKEENDEPVSVSIDPNDDGGVTVEDPEVTEETKYADELIYCIGDFASASPLNPSFVISSCTILMPMVYDTLLDRLPEGGYGPRLATSWDTEDYQNWHLTLRDDVTFHNGDPFNAQVVADSIEIVKSTPGAIGASKWADVESVEIINDYEIIIHLSRVLIDFDNYMADPMASIMDAKAIAEDPDNGVFVGTGDWIWKEGVPGSHIYLEDNPDFWGEKHPGHAKLFNMKVVTETTARDIMFQNKELDFAGASNDLLEQYEADPTIVVDRYVMSNTNYVCFNLNDPLMADINFRKAVLYCIDRQVCTDITFQGLAHTWDTNSYWGGRTDYKLEIPIIEQDLDAAKEFLAQSSYNGEKVQLWAAMPQTITNATIIAGQMEAIGINAEVFETDNANLSSSSLWGSNNYQMMVNSGPWSSLGSSCNMFFQAGAMANKAQWNNERVQELIALADKTPNGPDREAIYFEIQQICSDEIPFIGIANMMMLMARQANCGGVVYFTDNYHDYSNAYKIVEE